MTCMTVRACFLVSFVPAVQLADDLCCFSGQISSCFVPLHRLLPFSYPSMIFSPSLFYPLLAISILLFSPFTSIATHHSRSDLFLLF